MTTKKIITEDEIIELIKKVYGIKNVTFMRFNSYERDSECFDNFDYVIGEETNKTAFVYDEREVCDNKRAEE